MKLTEHQNEILAKSLDILSTSNKLLIKGSAGVGKTYLVKELIKNLISKKIISPYKKIYCSAPTNKAVSVLKSKVNGISNVDFITVHSALKLKREIDYKTGSVSFKPSYSNTKKPPLQGVSLLVIDETSMLNSDILSYIEDAVRLFNLKITFIGDFKQLPPVGEDKSPVFHQNYPEVELVEIIRQTKGNPIIDISNNLKLIYKKEDCFIVDNDNYIGYLFDNNFDHMVKRLGEVNGSDELKYLSWTNQDVDMVNQKVREFLYKTPKRIEKFESLVFNSPYKDNTYYTNQEVTVKDLEIVSQDFKINVKSNRTSGEYETEKVKLKCYVINNDILVLHEDSDKDFKILKSTLNNNCKARILEWVDYYFFIEQFADFKYNHAISVHKSQGSTYKKAIINLDNINFNKNISEKEKLLYTAITRASDLLIFYNKF